MSGLDVMMRGMAQAVPSGTITMELQVPIAKDRKVLVVLQGPQEDKGALDELYALVMRYSQGAAQEATDLATTSGPRVVAMPARGEE